MLSVLQSNNRLKTISASNRNKTSNAIPMQIRARRQTCDSRQSTYNDNFRIPKISTNGNANASGSAAARFIDNSFSQPSTPITTYAAHFNRLKESNTETNTHAVHGQPMKRTTERRFSIAQPPAKNRLISCANEDTDNGKFNFI